MPAPAPAAAPAPRPVVIFDGVCNLCNRAVQFILDHDRRGRLLLTAGQSEAGQALLRAHGVEQRAQDTIFLFDGQRQRIYDRSTAALRIARLLGFPWSLLSVFLVVPRLLRDPLYDLVARNRYRWFGRRESCRLPRPGEMDRFLL
jgi:predicted DCC family thiol-disulfide oxidoreductase YuxK